ncbi:transcriptional regulator NrdR [Candidatus Curtissbacteria bacterium RBG_16_39_7]|uniref:Transcriptional repressor NrdR n=1 Tax=Candidatus Curtissbacteria bacterium RBG_16_39_7 TaxID=1797707 RepID=A0A1F5G1W4_9BACT|nr:MAG: transcriptional regulator NrdR [Candidatus Curtissbacteria bacterium RBG_16_39_7]
MKCPYCGSSETRVVDKRESEDKKAVRRRRECIKCGKRFTTYERVETLDILVIKKDGLREPFDRDKIRSGIVKACIKRPVTVQQIDKIADEVEAEIRLKPEKEILSKKIGELVISKLKKLDKVAYVRFASIYREFTDLEDFQKALRELLKK